MINLTFFVTDELNEKLNTALEYLKSECISNADMSDVVNIFIQSGLDNLVSDGTTDDEYAETLEYVTEPLSLPDTGLLHAVRVTLSDKSLELIERTRQDVYTEINRDASPAVLILHCIDVANLSCLKLDASDYMGVGCGVYEVNIKRYTKSGDVCKK